MHDRLASMIIADSLRLSLFGSSFDVVSLLGIAHRLKMKLLIQPAKEDDNDYDKGYEEKHFEQRWIFIY